MKDIHSYITEIWMAALDGAGYRQAWGGRSLTITHPKPEFGDYATNGALILKKTAEGVEGDIAQKLVDALIYIDGGKVFESITSAGGFINFRVAAEVLVENLSTIYSQNMLYGASHRGVGKTALVEYFQNNVAKPPHVGHLRSAVVGDALKRILLFQGYNAISDTHIGDWGVQFGILLYAFKTLGDKKVIEQNPVEELNKLYVAMSAQIDADPALRDLGKAEFKKLEDGDEENRKLWEWFVQVSVADFERYRELLGVLPFEHNLGESFYEDKMAAVLDELKSKDLVSVGESGEKYVDLEPYGLGRCILVKSDGATTYHLRDFATYIYRKSNFYFEKNIYVVDNRQSHHFKQLFKVLELAGYPVNADSVHVDIGFMSLPEGAISTRKGTVISLQSLFSEAQKRVTEIIEEKNPDLSNKKVAIEQVASGAIKYFDLSHNRKSEIIFTWDKVLSFEGNTGPYVQYTHARIHGILRKAEQITSAPESVSEINEYERNILLKMYQFPEVVGAAAAEYLPHYIALYLFELSQCFNSFYQEVQVLTEQDTGIRNFRLQLISGVAQVIKNGLSLLGIEAPEEM